MKVTHFLSQSSQLLALGSAILAFAHVAPAQTAIITPKSQARSVQIGVTFSDVPKSTSAQASGYGVFNKTLNYAGGAGVDTFQVNAAQNSQIDAAAITATGSIFNRLGHPFAADGSAQSDFKVTFRVTQEVSYSLTGFLLWDEYFPDTTSSSPSVKLTGPLGVIFDVGEATSDATQLDYSGTGTLPPGEYVLEAHATSLIPFAGAYANKSFDLAFAVTPVGPPLPGPGQVYQLSGVLAGQTLFDGKFCSVAVRTSDLVNLGLGKPSTNVPRNEVLALVSDNIDHSLRVVVWDVKAGKVLAELGPLVLAGGLKSPTAFASIADYAVAKVGRLLDTLDGVPSMLTMAVKGTFDPANPATVTKLSATPCIGQLNYLDEAGANQTVVIQRGSLLTGRKLGTTP